MNAKLFLARTALRLARWSSAESLLRAAGAGAWQDPAANAAVYYTALRYFGLRANGQRVAVEAAARGNLSVGLRLQPLVELQQVRKDQRVPTAVRIIDRVLAHVDSGDGSAKAAASKKLAESLAYARCMLCGEFVEAFRHWVRIPETKPALAALVTPAKPGANGGRVNDWRSEATLGVVLPGAIDADRTEEIERHTFVARTDWSPRSASRASTGQRTDIVFLNLDKFVDAAAAGLPADIPLIVTKAGAKRKAKPVPAALVPRVRFALVEPELPTSNTTYLAVLVALWAMANFERPATFYFADFYLGNQTYEDAAYDAKRRLCTANDIRLAHLTHDVFFVHAALRRWFADGRIMAKGRFGAILEWDGEEFARRLDQRWGARTVGGGNARD